LLHSALWLEWFRLTKRLAAWGIFFAFLALQIAFYGGRYYDAQRGGAYWGFPDALPDVLAGRGTLTTSVFAAVLVGLTVSSEFEWRTGRQNVIDGLSKNRWFGGKVLLLLSLCIALYGTQVSLGATLGYLGTTAGHADYSSAVVYVSAAGGALIGMLTYCAAALLFSIAVRSSGPVIAITILYLIFDTLAASGLPAGVAALLPGQVQGALFQFGQYLPQPPASIAYHWSNPGLFLAGIAWMTAFLAASYWVYRTRDL
jgi:ABC-type transport system involved in multi-copper enzyme maturation permease subunit